MNRKSVFKTAGITTTITAFVVSIFLALLFFSGGTLFHIAEISIPFVFIAVNLLFLTARDKTVHKRAFLILQIVANVLLTAVYAVWMLKL
jgi:K+ transporter